MKKWTVVIGATVLVVAGCASPEQEDTASQTPAAGSSQELQAWASEVCTAADDLATTVTGVTAGLNVDLSAGLDQLPAIQEQVTANIDEVENRIDELQAALAQAPTDSPAAAEFTGEMQDLITSARESGQEAVGLLAEATAADNVLSAGLAAAGAAAAAQSAVGDATSALELLDGVRSSETGALGTAFNDAEGCSGP